MEYIRRFLEENGCDNFNDYYGLLEKCEIIALKNKKAVQDRVHELDSVKIEPLTE